MENKFVFNKKVYSFSQDQLKEVYRYMILNESLDEDDRLYTLSFVTNSIVRKTWEELDYHEFVLNGSFRLSNLLCNITNVFGEDKATEYGDGLAEILGGEEDINTTDYFTTISTSDATFVGKKVFKYPPQFEKFQMLLAYIHLGVCAGEDYEQLIEKEEDFHGIRNINGIVVRESEYEGKLMLKPIYQIYDSSIEEYKEFVRVLIPPSVILAIFHTEFKMSLLGQNEREMDFYLKTEQLSGTRLRVPAPKRKVTTWSIDSSIVGKWYSISKSIRPFASYFINIEWFLEDGSFKQSVIIVSTLDLPYTENWRPKNSSWKTNGEILVLHPGDYEELECQYKIVDNVLYLGERKYYRSLDEAKEALNLID